MVCILTHHLSPGDCVVMQAEGETAGSKALERGLLVMGSAGV